MSAIDFTLEVEKVADPKGDRIMVHMKRQVPAVPAVLTTSVCRAGTTPGDFGRRLREIRTVPGGRRLEVLGMSF